MKQQELKKCLARLKENDWLLDCYDKTEIEELVFRAFKHIGTLDAELRDDLILEFLYHIIINQKVSSTILRELLKRCVSEEHLYRGLGMSGDDSVYNRSFTILIIRYIIYYHNKYDQSLFTSEELRNLCKQVCLYIRQENDMRGYVEESGWAHALAHSATCLRTLALSNELKEQELLEILQVVKAKMTICDGVFKCDETERFTMVVINILSRDLLTEKDYIKWIYSFNELEKPPSIHEQMNQRENVLGFLRALYFRLKYKMPSCHLVFEIENVMNTINSFHNNMVE